MKFSATLFIEAESKEAAEGVLSQLEGSSEVVVMPPPGKVVVSVQPDSSAVAKDNDGNTLGTHNKK